MADNIEEVFRKHAHLTPDGQQLTLSEFRAAVEELLKREREKITEFAERHANKTILEWIRADQRTARTASEKGE